MITDILFRTLQPYTRYLFLFFFIGLLITISVFLYFRQVKPELTKFKQKNVPNYGGNNIVYVYFFNVDWCPHCIKSKPEWKQFCDKYDGNETNGFIINCVGGYNGTDCTNTDLNDVTEIIQKFNIEHYPTIKMVKDTNVIEFDAKINYENLEKFTNTVLNDE